MNLFKKVLLYVEFKLVLFLAYVISLVYVWMRSHGWLQVLYVHLFFVAIFSTVYFGRQFLWFFFSPLIAVILPAENYFLNKYLDNFKQNVPASSVIILGHADWFKLQAWIKPIVSKSELKELVLLLRKKEQDFSFYPKATLADVENIMNDKGIKEVYFVGHGDSHSFQLQTDDILYYCDFNDPKYTKEFVHQVHCGTPHGKSLVDYVVPKDNRAKCFMFRRPINAYVIEREFKKRAAEYPEESDR